MFALKRTMILGIVALLTLWILLLNMVQVIGASEALPPTLVSPANGAWVTENKPTFKWVFNNSQSGFNLQISSQTNFTTLVQNVTVKNSIQNYTLTTALEDGMYYWRVRTNDTSGIWSDWSTVWLVQVDTTPPNPVNVSLSRKWTELKVGELRIGGGEFIEISWTESNDPYFKQYEVYVSTDSSVLGAEKIATTMNVGSTTYTLEGLDPDTTYYISVVVVDQAGLSSEASTIIVTTSAPMNWLLMGGIALAVEVAIIAIFIIIKLFIKRR
ncbi:MAG: fibronectin type III domain-containing protein [Candidatus Bathyarchaeaceae archaeon]